MLFLYSICVCVWLFVSHQSLVSSLAPNPAHGPPRPRRREGACTSILAAKSNTQSPMTTHNADCANCDFRLGKVPARDWPVGSLRPLYQYKSDYPATVSEFRGPTWDPANLEGSAEQLKAWGTSSIITGYIPQVPHTYALVEAGYGIMNEHQVAIGESTCQAAFYANSTANGGKAQIEVRQMSQIALERATTARQAIQIMGDLATTYGFYSAEPSQEEAGEALTVVDTEEAWMFHVLPDDSGTSAVWVAQRVPYGHVSAVANQFVIRKIDPLSEDFMYSENIFDVAQRNNFWRPEDGPLDFTVTYSPPFVGYCCRRVWRIMSYFAPSKNYDPYTDYYGSDYPFAVRPENGDATKEDLMKLSRDHYEGTPFDLTQGMQAGPYGDPERWDRALTGDMTDAELNNGSFERAIDMFRTSYSIVATPRAHLPDEIGALVWFASHAPSRSCYVPVYVHAENIPRPYMHGSLFQYDDSVAFWNFVAAGNWAARFYAHAVPTIVSLQQDLESKHFAEADKIETSLNTLLQQHGQANSVAGGGNESISSSASHLIHNVKAKLEEFTRDRAELTVQSWRELFPRLITVFHDGYQAQALDSPNIQMGKLFYPEWWLRAVGYFDHKPVIDSDTIMFSSDPRLAASSSSSKSMAELALAAMLSGSVALVAGFLYAKKTVTGSISGPSRRGYLTVPTVNV